MTAAMRAIFPYHVEDKLKEEFFDGSQAGYYVDVGANDPQEGSQTWHLEQLGWDGIVIEPQPDLAERHRQKRRARVYNLACSSPENSGRMMPFHVAGIHSSLASSFFVAGMRREGIIDVPVKTLDEILTDAQAQIPIDLLSIDVESHEIE
ncbi:MAG TPA: FkbM family methyltransferase, partial [Xanthobacteraceae bacterium]|nr:FkbM family methyltransferase [Xanthobacteraceae bacterium]